MLGKRIICYLGQKAEKIFRDNWREIIKAVNAHNDPVLVYFLSWEKEEKHYKLTGDLSGSFSSIEENNELIGLRLRHNIMDNIVLTQGPLPTEKPTLAVLVPLPSFLFHAGVKGLKSLITDWRGEVMVENTPYCYLTLLI